MKTNDIQVMTRDTHPTNEKMIFKLFLVQPANTVKGLQIVQQVISSYSK